MRACPPLFRDGKPVAACCDFVSARTTLGIQSLCVAAAKSRLAMCSIHASSPAASCGACPDFPCSRAAITASRHLALTRRAVAAAVPEASPMARSAHCRRSSLSSLSTVARVKRAQSFVPIIWAMSAAPGPSAEDECLGVAPTRLPRERIASMRFSTSRLVAD